MSKVKITQTRSVIKKTARVKATVSALGLKRINHSVELELTPQIAGMIRKVNHLVTVTEL